MSSCKWLSLAPVMFLAAGVAAAAPTPLKATNTWMGSIDDEKLAKEMPENGVITNAKDFEKLVKAWKVADKVPEVDFTEEIVILTTTRGSKLRLAGTLGKRGNLEVGGWTTLDLAPGFRYVIATVSKEGVKKVNGKELPKE